MKTYLAISLLAVAAASFAEPACAQQVIAASSEIAFTSKQMGVPVDGKFRKFDAKVAFDPKKPEAASIGFHRPGERVARRRRDRGRGGQARLVRHQEVSAGQLPEQRGEGRRRRQV